AAHQSTTFSAQAAHSGLVGFPSMSQPAKDGALLTAAAAILRYYQNSGALPAPNGFADPPTLKDFLNSYCVLDVKGGQVCDGFINTSDSTFLNPWRLGSFVGGNLDVAIEKPDLSTVRDWLAQGAPLILELGVSS